MTVEEVIKETEILNLDNIKKFPMSRGLREDFYNMWQRFGPQAARHFILPSIWKGFVPRPSEIFNV